MGRGDYHERVYHERVLAGLRRHLLDPDGRPKRLGPKGTEERIALEDVRMEYRPEVKAQIVVLYRDVRRPECLFGWSMEAREAEEPEIRTTIVWANFCEHVIGSPSGLPVECREEGITWTD